MTIELTRKVAMDLIDSMVPSYKDLRELEHLGSYNDQYGKFYWNKEILETMNKEQLYNLYERYG